MSSFFVLRGSKKKKIQYLTLFILNRTQLCLAYSSYYGEECIVYFLLISEFNVCTENDKWDDC